MRRITLPAFLFFAATCSALAQAPAGAPPAAAGRGGPRPPPLMLSSSAIQDGGMVPDKYTAASQMPVTPPLSWTNVPAGTQSFVLIVHDVDVVMGRGLGDNPHWIVFNIPAATTSLAEGLPSTPTLPDGSIQMGRPGRGGAPATAGYFPFAPPPGFVHHYNFDLYALDTKLPLDTG
ncbi:MAG: YbhB/YbcL family Raf kinase inhibitor-like protein, partial [Alphaproteobacteria bacterium]|nr:YbhB/YbcL family Raf kinase inhibitor-like protein [Alphaproteobacteria bacterium]